jgi:threonine dehydrogenase-like Zn-dependent dehydrogenase
LGHEAVGEIVEVGSEVKEFKVGDKVLVPAVIPDWNCEAAQTGNSEHALSTTGYAQKAEETLTGCKYPLVLDGVFSELFVVTQADMNLTLLPDDIPIESAVMATDMLTTGLTGAENADIEFGDTVVVLGIGPVGLMAVAGAVHEGAGRVLAVGSRPNLVKLAKEYGATDIIDYHDGDTVTQILEATNGKGADSVIIAGGNESIMADAINMLRPGGTVSSVNYFGHEDIIPIPRAGWVWEWLTKQLKVD